MQAISISRLTYWSRLAAIYASIVCVSMAIGITFPLLSLELENRGYSNTVIGFFSAVASLAILIFGSRVPRVAEKFGFLRTILVGIVIGVVCFLTLPFIDSLALWFVLRFIMGMGWVAHWLLTEVWMNSLATDKNRSHVLALYSTFFAAGLSFGPFLLTIIGVDGLLPYKIVSALVLMGGAFLIFVRKHTPPAEDHHEDAHGMFTLFRLTPIIFVLAVCTGMFESTILSLMPLYGINAGLSEATSVMMLSLFVLGNVILQLPIAWIATKIGLQRAVIYTVIIGISGAIALPFLLHQPFLLKILLVIWGGILFGNYVLGLTMLGHSYKGRSLGVANAGFIVCVEFGSVVGPVTSGAAMDLWKPHGFILTILLFAVALLICALLKPYQEPKSEAEQIADI
jgi:MFS family permease